MFGENQVGYSKSRKASKMFNFPKESVSCAVSKSILNSPDFNRKKIKRYNIANFFITICALGTIGLYATDTGIFSAIKTMLNRSKQTSKLASTVKTAKDHPTPDTRVEKKVVEKEKVVKNDSTVRPWTEEDSEKYLASAAAILDKGPLDYEEFKNALAIYLKIRKHDRKAAHVGYLRFMDCARLAKPMGGDLYDFLLESARKIEASQEVLQLIDEAKKNKEGNEDKD